MKKVLAFDCGGTNTRLALINEKLEIEKSEVIPTVTCDKEKWINNLVKLIEKFPLENVVAISLGIPGVCDREKGVILDMSNVGIKDVEIRKILTQKFSLPVYIRNDAEVGCLGEAYSGSGKTFSRVFFITISTGLGGALCVDKINQDYVTEVGHTAFTYKNHLTEYEKLVSGLNIINLAKFNNINGVKTAREMFDGVRKNDQDCIVLFDEWLSILFKFFELIINSYNPDIICITGGLTKSKDLFLPKLQENFKNTKIVECFYKEEAGLYGSAVYGFQSILKN